MTWLAWALVIFLTALAATLGTAVLTGRGNRPSLDRLADPAPLPYELPRAGYFELPREFGGPFDLPGVLFEVGGGPYGPFPDTGPLLHLSEQAAARIALERDIAAMCAEAEAKIPPRWR